MQSIGSEAVLWSQSTNVLITWNQGQCRHDMNVLLSIKKDIDIVYKTPPSIEEVKVFEDETGDSNETCSSLQPEITFLTYS